MVGDAGHFGAVPRRTRGPAQVRACRSHCYRFAWREHRLDLLLSLMLCCTEELHKRLVYSPVLGERITQVAFTYLPSMLYVYISLHRPMMLAFLDLPVTGNQRSSPWDRSTRRELRDLAHLVMHDRLAQSGKNVTEVTESIASEGTGKTWLELRIDARVIGMRICRRKIASTDVRIEASCDNRLPEQLPTYREAIRNTSSS
jgi:hypothetical protein